MTLLIGFLATLGCSELGSTLVIGDQSSLVEPSEVTDPAQVADSTDPTDASDSSDVADPAALDDPETVVCRLHVQPDGSGDGGSWDSAMLLSDALDQLSAALASGACPSGEVWMKGGIYAPGTNAEESFVLVSGMTLYGGFFGNESSVSQRNLSQNTTTLSGLLEDGSRAHHVLLAQSQDTSEIRLDGITVQSGGAVGTGDQRFGGGLYSLDSRVRLVDVSFISNEALLQGGGAYVQGGVLSIERVRFVSNMAGSDGGGMAVVDAALMVTGLEMISNAADRGGALFSANASEVRLENTEWITQAARLGGAIYDNGSQNFIVNQGRFQSNQGSEQGAAIYLMQTQSPMIGNAAFFNNAAPRGASVAADAVADLTLAGVSLAGNLPENGANLEVTGAAMTVVNSILWDNITEISALDGGSIDVSWSIAPAEVEGENLISSDPLFLSAPTNDGTGAAPNLELQAGSPAIDSGNNDSIPSGLGNVDAGGGARRLDDPATADAGQGEAPIVDRGAFER